MNKELIAKVPLLSSLPREEIDYLAETLHPCEFNEGAIILHEGRTDEIFYIIMEGQVEIIKALGTIDERTLAVHGEGAFLGEMSLFSQAGCHTASVRALTPVHLLLMRRADFKALLNRQPSIAYELVSLLSKRLEESENTTILDLREKNRELTLAYLELQAAQAQIIQKEKLERELEIARQIQLDILPHRLPRNKCFEFGAKMIPAYAVGGDLYQFIKLDQNRLGIVVGDVSDKGVPAALFMALTYSLMRAEAQRHSQPVEVLRAVNSHLLEMNATGMFVTMVYGVLDCIAGQFKYVRAGHLPPLLMDEHGSKIDVGLGLGQPLGFLENPLLDEGIVAIDPGFSVLIFSDGLTETMNSQGDIFGVERIREVLSANLRTSAQGLCDLLWEQVKAFCDPQGQQDDFTVVTIKGRDR